LLDSLLQETLIMVRVGVVGFGHLGQFLVESIQKHPDLELAWVWNRSDISDKVDASLILRDLSEVGWREPEVIVEVAHPDVTKQYGALFLKTADFLMGSPTGLADRQLETDLKQAAQKHGLYIPSGAFWGGEDIRKMAERGTLSGLTVTMRKHPSSFKLNGDLKAINDNVKEGSIELYRGPVRELCPLAPNNVNTMAAAAVAASNLGFDKTVGVLVSDPGLTDWHIVEVEVEGPVGPSGGQFTVRTERRNPARPGAVTGSATYNSFLSSLLRAGGKGPGFHLC